jgi:glycosyltransferase involved in cell wall biosynthesis
MPTRPLKVGCYYPWLYLTSGAERSILKLVEHSRHQWVLLTNRFEPENTFPGLARRNIVELPKLSVERTVGKTAHSCWKLLWQKLPLQDLDALVVVCEGIGDLVLLRSHSRPAICICLTPLRIAFDEEYRARSAASSPLWKRGMVSAGAALFRMVDRIAWRYYDRRFCISREVIRRVVKGGLARKEQLELLYPALGVRPGQFVPEYEPFFLIPGRIMWTKNIELGIEAFHWFRRDHPEFAHFRLVIAGMVDKKSESYLSQLRAKAGEGTGIEFRIRPSDEELSELYRTCCAMLFTPFNEDYGIVPLEAMAHAKPVIAVNRGGPLDTVENNVVGYLEDPEPAAFARRMAELAGSPETARRMGAAGRMHAQKYDWNQFARVVDDALDSLAESVKRVGVQTTTRPASMGTMDGSAG